MGTATITPTGAEQRPRPLRRRLGTGLDVLLVLVVVGVIALANVEGRDLLHSGVDIYLGWPPLLAVWSPHHGLGTIPVVLLAVLVVARGTELAARLRWVPLLGGAYLASVAWTFGLALVDGWRDGVAGRLATDREYLNDVGRVPDLGAMLRDFTTHILPEFPGAWSMHVGAHPPGVFLAYLLMTRAGLGHGGCAVVTILVGASAVVAVAVTVRALGGETVARRMLPFGVLFPGAVWIGVSADGMFAGVLAWGVALFALGCTGNRRWRLLAALAGGLLLGYALFLSYGLATAALLPVAVFALRRRWFAAGAAVLGAGAVVALFAAAGFWWLDGYDLVQIDYAQSVAKTRPYAYFVWADLAALAFVLGPAVVAGLRRACARPRWLPPTAALLVGAALVAVIASDLSGFSKGEVERIWLPFAVWLTIPCALLPRRGVRYWLAAQALLAILVNHLLFTFW